MINQPMLNTGVFEQKEKVTDFKLNELASATPIPDSYETPYTGVIYHQHKTPACGAHAGAYIKNIQEGREHSPMYLWKRIKYWDGIPAESGTSMEAIFKTLQKYGVCSLDLMPNNSETTTENYTKITDVTEEMDADALKSRIGAYGYNWLPTFDSIKRAIYDHKVILMRVEISADWWTPSWDAEDILPLHKKFPGQGGHFVVAHGYTPDSILGINEWGITWGADGKFYFKETYMGRVTYIGTCFDYIEKAPTIFTRTLKFDMRGTDVGVLQQMLKDKGYFPASQKITSYFGRVTLESVSRFQKEKGLIADGVVGKKTQEALVK